MAMAEAFEKMRQLSVSQSRAHLNMSSTEDINDCSKACAAIIDVYSDQLWPKYIG
jgi:hypothetical protein